ncbi:MAG TPA: hemerythrin domain-containing protein [Rhodanobacteraceae bacterium]
MGFFRKLLGKSDVSVAPPAAAAAPVAAPVAPSGAPAAHRSVNYDAKLIESLLRDHAELGRLFGNIGDAEKTGNFSDVRAQLVQFKTRLEAHILTENVRFYTYLDQSLGGDPNNASVMHDFRREMNGIARGVVDFVRKYQACEFSAAERLQFTTDYAAVGKLLEQRLDSEENSLYPLYQPS